MTSDPASRHVRTLYVICHTHTDIGYTDYQDTLFRRQNAIMEEAIELCEATADAPGGAQFRWTAEVASLADDFLRQASPALVDRFQALERAGRISVMGLPWHWTPLVTPAVALREMESVARMRREHGVTIRSAVQSDVNGLAWFWVDLLAACGISRFAMFANPHRGLIDRELPRAFNWNGPEGGKLLTWQGWHYSIGPSIFRLGYDPNDIVAPRIEAWLQPLEARAAAGAYPFNFALVNVTNHANADNNMPQHGLSEAVAAWNASGRTPRIEIVTVDQFFDVLEPHAAGLPEQTGDWADPWVDGVASTARETALNRSAERVLPGLDNLMAASSAKPSDALTSNDLARAMALYDEHTWGAYSSVSLPEIPFSQSQLIDKRRHAHRAFWATQEHLATVARSHAATVVDGPVEGHPTLGRLTVKDLAADEQSYLVVNPTNRRRRVVWPVTPDRGSERPHEVLHSMLADRHHPGMGLTDSRGQKFGGTASEEPGTGHIDVTLGPFESAVVRPVEDAPQGEVGDLSIANDFYRLEVAPETGAIAKLEDRQDGVSFAAGSGGTGALFAGFLETLASDRTAIFTSDFETFEGMEWHDPDFDLSSPQVTVLKARMSQFGPEISAELRFADGISATVTYRLLSHTKCVEVDIIQSLGRVDDGVRALYWQIAAGAGVDCEWRFDQAGRLVAPGQALPSSCSTWIAAHDAVTMVAKDNSKALAVVPLDTPLIMPRTIRPAGVFGEPRESVEALYFWAYNNHWDTNFAAYETGDLPARFRLLTGRSLSDEQVHAFAAEQSTAPIIVRAPNASPGPRPPLVEIDTEAGEASALIVSLREQADGRIVLTLRNSAGAPFAGTIRLPARRIETAAASSPIGEESAAPEPAGGGVRCEVAGGATASWTLTVRDR